MNTLCHEKLLAEDQLFATLDSTTRTLILSPQEKVLVTDTVGFIQKLPHQLVTSFKSTLEELQHADILLHVADASSEKLSEMIKIHRQYQSLGRSIQQEHERQMKAINRLSRRPSAA